MCRAWNASAAVDIGLVRVGWTRSTFATLLRRLSERVTIGKAFNQTWFELAMLLLLLLLLLLAQRAGKAVHVRE